jgi:hypothetical protein
MREKIAFALVISACVITIWSVENMTLADHQKDLQITLEAPVSEWARKGDLKLLIQLEGLEKPFKAISSLILEPKEKGTTYWKSYWAPFELKKGESMKLYSWLEKSNLYQMPLKLEIDPRELLWEKKIGAVWPSRRIFDVVPVGSYQLYVEVNILEITEEAERG